MRNFNQYRGDGSRREPAAEAQPAAADRSGAHPGEGDHAGTVQGDTDGAGAVHHRERGSYRASPELVEAVNLAIAVEQPLLVTGEPGCGKTRLAWSVAAELDPGAPPEEAPLTFYTKSTSRAQDLLYTYDAVRHFKDIQLRLPDAGNINQYLSWGAFGKAIRAPKRRVVLIDEIDKAPRDFPNDLLTELDRMQFEVHELPEEQRKQKTTARPIVIITSNSERQLPLPFLRRCVFHHIEFPNREQLIQIIEERLGSGGIGGIDKQLIGSAVDKFGQVREIPKLTKKPATGELIAWVVGLAARGIGAAELGRAALGQLPLWQALIKDQDDFGRLQNARA